MPPFALDGDDIVVGVEMEGRLGGVEVDVGGGRHGGLRWAMGDFRRAGRRERAPISGPGQLTFDSARCPGQRRATMPLADLRKDYALAGLAEKDLARDPFRQFEK